MANERAARLLLTGIETSTLKPGYLAAAADAAALAATAIKARLAGA